MLHDPPFYLFIYFLAVEDPVEVAAAPCDWPYGTCTYVNDPCPPNWERCPSRDPGCPVKTNHCCCRKTPSKLLKSWERGEEGREGSSRVSKRQEGVSEPPQLDIPLSRFGPTPPPSSHTPQNKTEQKARCYRTIM